MLLVLDPSLAKALAGQTQPEDAIVEALETVARARRQGKHLVFAERQALEVYAEY